MHRSARLATLLLLAAPSALADPPVVLTRRALDHLGAVAVQWLADFGCSGCHKQGLTLEALAVARNRGYEPAKPGIVDALIAGFLAGNSGQDTNGCFSFEKQRAFNVGSAWGGRGLTAYDRWLGADKQTSLKAAADCLLAKQAADGRIPSDHSELPVAQGDPIVTAHAVVTWLRQHEHVGGSTSSYRTAGNRAVSWLRGRVGAMESTPAAFTTQDKASVLLGIAQSGVGPTDSDVVRLRNLLASEQLADRSWKSRAASGGGNAYATGEVIFALRSAGFARTDVAVDRGTQWLLDNEQPDGGWLASNWDGNNPSTVVPSMWAALALATYPSPLNGLRIDGASKSSIHWAAVDGATSYDLVRGDVAQLSADATHVDLGAVTCVGSATTATSIDDPAQPIAGHATFYLLRIRWSGARDIYGRSADGLDESPQSGDCPQ